MATDPTAPERVPDEMVRVAIDGTMARWVGPWVREDVARAVLAAALPVQPKRPAEMIREFHAALGDEPHDLEFPTRGVEALRQRLLDEEVQELRDASEASDIVAVADALADIVYVTYGTAYAHGIDLDAVLAEVHRSNMTKDFSGPPGDRKAQKGPDYEPPNIARVLGMEPADA